MLAHALPHPDGSRETHVGRFWNTWFTGAAPGEKGHVAAGRGPDGLLFILPALIGLLVFYVLPTLRAAQISLTDWNLIRRARWVAFDNYERLWGDGKFWDSMLVTLAYVIYNIPLQTVLGLLIAVLADRLARSVALRAVIIAPYLISNVVADLV